MLRIQALAILTCQPELTVDINGGRRQKGYNDRGRV